MRLRQRPVWRLQWDGLRLCEAFRLVRHPRLPQSRQSAQTILVQIYERTVTTLNCDAEAGGTRVNAASNLQVRSVSMELIDHFRRQFAYNEWANREVLATLRDTAGSLERPIQYLAH